MLLTPLQETVVKVLREHSAPGAPDVFRRIRHVELEKGSDGYPVITADVVVRRPARPRSDR
jgi:hypothetical protein